MVKFSRVNLRLNKLHFSYRALNYASKRFSRELKQKARVGTPCLVSPRECVRTFRRHLDG